MKSSINAIVGRSDQNLSSALNSLTDIHVRFTTDNDDEHALLSHSENKRNKKAAKRRLNTTYDLDRQLSTTQSKIDQFQVKDFRFSSEYLSL